MSLIPSDHLEQRLQDQSYCWPGAWDTENMIEHLMLYETQYAKNYDIWISLDFLVGDDNWECIFDSLRGQALK